MKFPRMLRTLMANFLYLVVNFIQRSPHKKIQMAFRQRYTGATFPTWEYRGDEGWEVTFNDGKIEHCAIFDSGGHWLGTRTLISRNMLPNKIWDHLRLHFVKPDFLKIFELTMPQGLFYELDIYDGTNFIHLYYNGKGELHNQGVF